MKAEETKKLLATTKFYFLAEEIKKGFSVCAWVDLADCMIYHSINGEVMALVFPNLEAFAKHIEQISEPQMPE